MPKVSVIIPVYNTEQWLEECIDSVSKQTYQDLEIICIDDSSTDGSSDLLKANALKDNRIKIVTLEKNSGLASVRNIGMDLAKGEYIYFVDSDDSIQMNTIERLYNISTSYLLDVVYFDGYALFDSEEFKKIFDPNIYSRKKTEGTRTIISGIEMFEYLYSNDEWSNEVPRQFYSKKFLKRNHIRFYEGIIHEDVLFSFQCAFYAKRALLIPDRLYNRRYRNNSIITSEKNAKNFCGIFCSAFYINRYIHTKNLYNDIMKSYVARLNNQAIRLFNEFRYDTLSEIEKLCDDKLLFAYYQFESLQDTYCAYGDISEKLLNTIFQYEKVFIYGAGVVAKSVYEGLIRKNVLISGFVVTNEQNNPNVVNGHPVYGIDFFSHSEFRDNCIVVVSLKNGIEEIVDMLNKMEIACISFR